MASEVRGIADISDTVGAVGRAVTGVGETIRRLPLIGDEAARPAEELDRAGRDAVVSARSARGSARRVGVLLGISIALIPTLPLLAIYLPTRYAAAHERRALRRAVHAGRSASLEEFSRGGRSCNFPLVLRPDDRVVSARVDGERIPLLSTDLGRPMVVDTSDTVVLPADVTVGDQAVTALNEALGVEVFERGLQLGRLTTRAQRP